MSSSFVRAKFREWLNDPAIVTPYYDTINLEQNPPEDTWVTAEFEVTFREKKTFCEGSWEEEGDVSLMFNGIAGIGDGALLSISEQDMKTLLSFRDESRQLTVIGVTGVNEFSGGSANMGYQLEYILEYQFTENES
jgi:hypothetical protein